MRIQILNILVEGSGIRATTRIIGVSVNTVKKLLVDAGTVSDIFNYHQIRNVHCSQIQRDKQWSFVCAKDKTVNRNKIRGNPEHAGTVWL